MSYDEAFPERLSGREQLNLVLDEIFIDGKTDLEIDSPRAGVHRVWGVFDGDTPYGERVGNHYMGLLYSKGLAPESEKYHVEAHPFDETKPSMFLEYSPRSQSIKIIEVTAGSEPKIRTGYGIGVKEMLDFAFEIVEAERINRPDIAIARLSDVEPEDIRFELQPLAA